MAELGARCTEMAAIHRHMSVPGIEAEIARHLLRRQKLIAEAMPICEYIQRRREIGDKISGSGSFEVRGAYWSLHRKLAADHKYAPGLEAAVDNALLGKPSTPEAEAIFKFHRA